MSDEECYYGEIPEYSVDPKLVARAKEVLNFCIERHGTSGQEIKMRWLQKGEVYYHLHRHAA